MNENEVDIRTPEGLTNGVMKSAIWQTERTKEVLAVCMAQLIEKHPGSEELLTEVFQDLSVALMFDLQEQREKTLEHFKTFFAELAEDRAAREAERGAERGARKAERGEDRNKAWEAEVEAEFKKAGKEWKRTKD